MSTVAVDDDDPLSAALAEAESFMESLGIGDDSIDVAGTSTSTGIAAPIVNDTNNSNNNKDIVTTGTTGTTGTANADSGTGFAIDSDDEEEDENGAVLLNKLDGKNKSMKVTTGVAPSTPSTAATSSTNVSSHPLHPLSDTFLSSQQQQQQQQAQQATTGSTTSSIDLMKSTSRFASGLASMAQRATAVAATAAAGVATTTTSTVTDPLSTTTPSSVSTTASSFGSLFTTTTPTAGAGGNHFAVNQQQQPYQQMMQQPIMTSPHQQQQQQIHQQRMQSAPPFQQQFQQQQLNAVVSPSPVPVVPELDKEQKAELIRTHVGPLLPGEQLILLVPNVIQVIDSCTAASTVTGTIPSSNSSTSSNGSSTTSTGGGGWYCAITYYRVLFFQTSSSNDSTIDESLQCPIGFSTLCWPMKLSEKVIQIPLSCIEKIERTSSVVQQQQGVGIGGGGINGPLLSSTTILGLLIHSKLSGRQIRIVISYNYIDTIKFHEQLSSYCFPGRRNLGYLFAFECKRDAVMNSIKVIDPINQTRTVTLEPLPKRFNPIIEYERQFNSTDLTSTGTTSSTRLFKPWMIWTKINSTYQLCGSYPDTIVGPSTLNSDPNNVAAVNEAVRVIRQCASFRSEQRLPVLTWTLPDGSGGSIWRCSQPKIGLQGNRSQADELFFKHILESSIAANNYKLSSIQQQQQQQQSQQYSTSEYTTTSTTPFRIPAISRQAIVQLTGSYDITNWIINDRQGCGIKILDLRPRSSAMANRTGGYGYENTSNYIGTTLQFCNIGNIHAVRDSYQRLCNVCNSYNPQYDMNWTSTIEDTKWLYHIRLILSASWEAAYWTSVFKIPVVIHCSHGWDRTSQVSALAQILLDPYYRTCAGVACLIEKDFMSFGHPFHTRSGHGEGIGPSGTAATSSNSTTSTSINSMTNNGVNTGGSSITNNSIISSTSSVVSNNPIFNTIQQHTGGLVASTLSAAASGITAAASNIAASSSSVSASSASSPSSGNGTNHYNNNNNSTNSNNNNGSNNNNNGFDESQISPIFLQFLDCLYQIVELYPDAFEYNTKYIYLLSEHVYSCRFGNFLCDTEREREVSTGIRQRTESIWDYLESRPDVYNKKYNSNNNNTASTTTSSSSTTNNGDGVLLMPLPVLLRNVRLWTDRHCKYSSKATVRNTTSSTNSNNNYYDNEWYVNNAIIQSKYYNLEQTPVITHQEHLRMLLSSSNSSSNSSHDNNATTPTTTISESIIT